MNRDEQAAGVGKTEAPRTLMERAWGPVPGKGGLAVVASRPGLGKTALLVQVAVGDLMAGRKVLHVGIGQSIEHVQSWYDGLFEELCRASVYDESDRNRLVETRHIRTYGHGGIDADRLRQDLEMLSRDAGFEPHTVLLDGFRAPDPGPEEIEALSRLASERGLELWVAVAVPGSVVSEDESGSRALAALPSHVVERSRIQVGLEPCSNGICVIAASGATGDPGKPLYLHPDTMLVSQA